MRSVLFLDIDGVLNAVRTCVGLGTYPHDLTAEHVALLDATALGLIRRLCQSSYCDVVLSSSWRITHDWRDVGRALRLPIVDCTPRLLGPRGKEIAAWLEAHPDVTRYAIVDDDSDMLPEQLAHFVKTDVNEGLLWRDYVRLCDLFGVGPYEGGPRAAKLEAVIGGSGSLVWDEPPAAC